VSSKTITSQMINGTTISLFSLVFVKGVNLVRTMIVARLIPSFDFGLFSLLFSFFYLALNIAVFGFPATSARFIASLGDRQDKVWVFLFNLYFLALSFAFIVGIGVIALADFIALRVYREPGLSLPLRWMGGAIFFQSLFAVNLAILQGFSLYFQRSVLEMIDSLISFGVMVFLVSRFSFLGAALAFCLGGIVSFLISSLVILAKVKFRERLTKISILDKGVVRKIIGFAFPLFLTTTSIYLFYWAGDVLLKQYSSHVEQVGWMYIARSLGQIILFLPAAMCIPLLPVVSTDNRKSDLIGNFLQVSWLFSCFVGIVIGATSKILIPLLFGNNYSAASYAVFLYSVASIPMAMTTSIFSTILTGRGFTWPLMALNIVWGCIFILLAYLLLPFLEIEGMMYAYLVSYGLLATMVVLFMKKQGIPSGITGRILFYFLGSVSVTVLLFERLEGLPYGISIGVWIIVMFFWGVSLLEWKNRKELVKRLQRSLFF